MKKTVNIPVLNKVANVATNINYLKDSEGNEVITFDLGIITPADLLFKTDESIEILADNRYFVLDQDDLFKLTDKELEELKNPVTDTLINEPS